MRTEKKWGEFIQKQETNAITEWTQVNRITNQGNSGKLGQRNKDRRSGTGKNTTKGHCTLSPKFSLSQSLSYQNACYRCENTENRTLSEFFWQTKVSKNSLQTWLTHCEVVLFLNVRKMKEWMQYSYLCFTSSRIALAESAHLFCSSVRFQLFFFFSCKRLYNIHFTSFDRFYVERVTAHRIKINDHSCFHNLWPNSKSKLKWKDFFGASLVFRGPTKLAYSANREDRLCVTLLQCYYKHDLAHC